MASEKKNIFVYDMRKDEAFNSLSLSFAHVLQAIEPLGSIAVPYKGQNLYHPFQIGIIGQSRSGKSTFVLNAVNRFFASGGAHYEQRLEPSADETRNVLVWSRWSAKDRPFEIIDEDTFAQVSLAGVAANVFPPEINKPAIRFFEHARGMEDFCPMMLHFDYDARGDRHLTIATTDEVAGLTGFKDEFLVQAADFQIT